MNDDVARLLRHQEGVATMAQLIGQGHSESAVRAEVAARRWQRAGSRCVIAHNAVPTRRQLMWASELDPVGAAALAGLTSLEVVGLRFFGTEMEQIHVAVPRGAPYHRLPGARIHESRRFDPDRVVLDARIPRLPTARPVLDAAAWQPNGRYAAALLAAAVQQKLCTADHLADELPHVGRIRHKPLMRLTVLDIAGGALALSGIDVADLCRRHHLEPPRRQCVRRDHRGRKRYLDCEWTVANGVTVVLEVDGAHHLLVEHWEADMKRERGAVGVPTELSGPGVVITT